MPEPIKFRPPTTYGDSEPDDHHEQPAVHPSTPSNSVHARVGDLVLHAARQGIRRGLRPEEIIREIIANHHVHLTLGELRLLLASRDRTNRGTGKPSTDASASEPIPPGKD